MLPTYNSKAGPWQLLSPGAAAPVAPLIFMPVCAGNDGCSPTVQTVNVNAWSGIISVLQINLGILSPNIPLMLPLCFKMWIFYCYMVLVPCHYSQQCILSVAFAEVAGFRLLFAVIHCCHTILLYALMQVAFTFAGLCIEGWNHQGIPIL